MVIIMADIASKLERAGVIAESNRLPGSSLSLKDRATILEARKDAELAGWDRDSIEDLIEQGRSRAREKFRQAY